VHPIFESNSGVCAARRRQRLNAQGSFRQPGRARLRRTNRVVGVDPHFAMMVYRNPIQVKTLPKWFRGYL
jgi:hypothetical protein